MVREHSRPWPSPTCTRARRRGRLGDRRPRVSERDGRRRCTGFGARKRRRCRRATRRGDDDACARSSTPRRSHGSLLDASRASRRRRGPSRRPRPPGARRVPPPRTGTLFFSRGRATRPPLARRDSPEPRLTLSVPPSHHPASIHSPSRSTRSRISPHRPSQGCEAGEDQEVRVQDQVQGACSKYLYTLCVDDANKAKKLKQSLPRVCSSRTSKRCPRVTGRVR